MSEKRVALVTAGASGIGRAIAECLLADGASVHICDLDEAALAACREELADVTTSCCDVADASQVEGLFADIRQHYDRLDILVNNVGIAGPTAAVEDIAPGDWDRTIAVDLNSAFYVTRLAAPLLKQSRGSIVNMASNAALFGFPLRSAYTAAKWGLIGLTKTWAMELGPDGVNVNALCPGSVSGPRIENVINKDAAERGVSPDEIRHVYQRQSSMRLFVEASDIAETVRFLCSPAGHSISGQAMGIDGHTEGLSNWLD
ncbi:3-oxoacyl-[acyl-carrier-protein] reductase [Halioglobus japonicus]|nr:SDR family oxidoreductase [Halioglobus japonicus]AQA18166.1 3-oxoacyl-[acyl-carrier-protein] reductase [Halioglobus japonicus]GHD14096.1 short-chain dehydrogenase/reductase [Halioglobus japonicus]